MLLMVSVPLCEPVTVGANFTCRVTVCFGLRVTGREPEKLNPLPLMDAESILSAAVPVEVSVTGNVTLCPVATLPKLKYIGLIVHCGAVALAFVGLTAATGFVLAADTLTRYPHLETMRIRRRQQARKIKAVPHQPPYTGPRALICALDESFGKRSRHVETHNTSSESEGGVIRDTNSPLQISSSGR